MLFSLLLLSLRFNFASKLKKSQQIHKILLKSSCSTHSNGLLKSHGHKEESEYIKNSGKLFQGSFTTTLTWTKILFPLVVHLIHKY